MNMLRRHVIALVSTILASLVTLVAWPHLPERMPLHWNLSGQPDRWGSRVEGALLGPVVILVLWGLMALLAHRRRRLEGEAKAGDKRDLIESLVLVLFAGLHIVAMAASAGLLHEPARGLVLMLAGFFIVGGNFMGKVRPNRWTGIRTPWTLESDEVWRATHRLGGPVMVGAGVVLVLLALTLSLSALMEAFMALLVVIVLVPSVYSYVLARRERRAG